MNQSFPNWENSDKNDTAVARTLIGGGGGVIHIFMFCPTSFFWNQVQIYQFEKKLVGQNMNIWIAES